MKKQHRAVLYALVFVTVFAVFLTRKAKPAEQSITVGDCFDTVCEITAVTKRKAVLEACGDYMRSMDGELSAEDDASPLSKRNRGEYAELSDDAEELIEFGTRFTEENPEYFSIFLNPLVRLWDIKNNTGTIPDVSAAVSAVNSKKDINLGAVAKGFVTDKIVSYLSENGVSSALVNLGGNAYALGKKPTGENWKIGIQDPNEEDRLIGVVTAENIAVVTSGDYFRYFEKDGIRYHHILDPRTGYPSDSGLHSVTVISENAALADALSTAIFVAGAEKGAELLKKYGAYGVFVGDDTVWISKDMENIFRQTNFSYKYEFMY